MTNSIRVPGFLEASLMAAQLIGAPAAAVPFQASSSLFEKAMPITPRICQLCEEEIAPKRLRAIPWAAY